MTKPTPENLKDATKEYVRAWLANGGRVHEVDCPHCRKPQAIPAPEGNDVWDSFATCVDCGGMYYKTVTARFVTLEAV